MVITQKIFSMELDWNGWIKHVPRFGMVVYNASRWSLGLCAGSELCSRNCAGLSPLPAVLTASHCIPCSLLLPGHCVPGCCENTALPTLSGDLSWGCEVDKVLPKTRADRSLCRKDHCSLVGGHENSRISMAKALPQGLVSCLPCCKAGSPPPTGCFDHTPSP